MVSLPTLLFAHEVVHGEPDLLFVLRVGGGVRFEANAFCYFLRKREASFTLQASAPSYFVPVFFIRCKSRGSAFAVLPRMTGVTAWGGAGEGGGRCRVFPKTNTWQKSVQVSTYFPCSVDHGSCLSMLSSARNMDVLRQRWQRLVCRKTTITATIRTDRSLVQWQFAVPRYYTAYPSTYFVKFFTTVVAVLPAPPSW